MKTLFVVAVAALATLFVLTTWVDFPGPREQARQYFQEGDIKAGLEYAAAGRWISWTSSAVHLGYLAALVFLGFGRRLADWAGRLTGRRWPLSVAVVTAACFLGDQLLKVPLRLAGLETARRFGMTTLSWLAWFEDFAKTLALSGLLQVAVLVGLFALVAWLPRAWWVVGGFLSVALGYVFALVLPVWVSPLFNDFRPLQDPTLEKSVLDLAGRAGVAVREVLVMDASRRTRHTNAYYTGFGSTQRIVVYDTLLREPAPNAAAVVGLGGAPGGQGPLLAVTGLVGARSANSARVTSVLAHEIGHWKHAHIVKGIALAGVGAFVGLFVLSLVWRGNVGKGPIRLRGMTDPAAVPLILLLFTLGNWLVTPVENAISREFERQADWTALELTQDPQVFIEAEKYLARTNKGNVAPNPVAQWFFSSHPSTVERIEMAERWRREHAREH